MEERYITSKIEPPEAKIFGVITLQDGEFHTGFALWHKRNDSQIPKFSSALPGQGFPRIPQPLTLSIRFHSHTAGDPWLPHPALNPFYSQPML